VYTVHSAWKSTCVYLPQKFSEYHSQKCALLLLSVCYYCLYNWSCCLYNCSFYLHNGSWCLYNCSFCLHNGSSVCATAPAFCSTAPAVCTSAPFVSTTAPDVCTTAFCLYNCSWGRVNEDQGGADRRLRTRFLADDWSSLLTPDVHTLWKWQVPGFWSLYDNLNMGSGADVTGGPRTYSEPINVCCDNRRSLYFRVIGYYFFLGICF
jgi:hypothetical protein